jgi:hypothetical protein
MEIDSENRIKIDEIIESNWIKHWDKVSKIVLSTTEQIRMTTDEEMNEIREAISYSNTENRVELVPIKSLQFSENPLLKRRLQTLQSRESATAEQDSSGINSLNK